MIELGQSEKERCILVGVTTRSTRKGEAEESLDELALLADTAGAEVVLRIIQDRDRFDAATLIGKGKVEELTYLVREKNIPLVIFDDDLSAVQVRNLERALECKILDRSALILDIFASRAKTNEAKTQVELAQLQYLLPRLTRQWTHLSKQFGGIGTKGPGETQIETDRRMIKAKIGHLKEKLERIGRQRITQRKARKKHIRGALVGYTNAGKSTLLNLLSGSDVLVENRLFATLDPTTRLVSLTPGTDILITDTVGFIRKLPHDLIASFKSTLEEITEADFLLHVVDISDSHYKERIQVVRQTLDEIHGENKPTLMVLNKIDRLADRAIVARLSQEYHQSVFISAARGINILGLKERIVQLLETEFVEKDLKISQKHQKLISQLYEAGEVLEVSYENNSVLMKIRLPKKEAERITQLVKKSEEEPTGSP